MEKKNRTVIPGPPGTGKTYRLLNHYMTKEIKENKNIKEKEFAKYNTDSSAAPAANFGIFWVTAFFFVGLYILFTGPEGTWPFFVINVIVFAMATVYNFCFHFKIAFLFGRDKVNSTIEQPIVSAVVLVLNLIIIYGLSDKIYL